MAIKSNVDFGVVNLSVGDNTVINGSSRGQRYAVSRSSLHNPTAGPINVNIYQSPNFTSASGIFIDSYALAAGDSDIFPTHSNIRRTFCQPLL